MFEWHYKLDIIVKWLHLHNLSHLKSDYMFYVTYPSLKLDYDGLLIHQVHLFLNWHSQFHFFETELNLIVFEYLAHFFEIKISLLGLIIFF